MLISSSSQPLNSVAQEDSMIRHVVFFKFKSEASEEQRESALAGLRKLPDRIDVIRELEVGRDIMRSPRAWDAVLIGAYDDLDALRKYDEHEAHRQAVQVMRSVCEAVGSVDFEVD